MTTTRRRQTLTSTPAASDRALLPVAVPRPVKRASGRSDIWRTPAHVRVIGIAIDDDDRAAIRRKLSMQLGKFAASIERIFVRITDANGPRGGVDQVCTVKVVLSGLPSVVIERRHAALHAALDAALGAGGHVANVTITSTMYRASRGHRHRGRVCARGRMTTPLSSRSHTRAER